MFVVSVEGKGDGSGNFTGYKRPGISIFSNKDNAAVAIFRYLKSLDEYEIIDEDLLTDEYTDEALNNSLLQISYRIINEGGHKTHDYRWIRVDIVPVDTHSLNPDHYADWDLPSSFKPVNPFPQDLPGFVAPQYFS